MKIPSKACVKGQFWGSDLILCHFQVPHCSLLSVLCSFTTSLLVYLPLKTNERLSRCGSFTHILSLNCVVHLLRSCLWTGWFFHLDLFFEAAVREQLKFLKPDWSPSIPCLPAAFSPQLVPPTLGITTLAQQRNEFYLRCSQQFFTFKFFKKLNLRSLISCKK